MASSTTTRPLRILIVRVGAMGDVLHGLPAVAGLRALLPDAHIGWAVEPRWRALLGAPVVDRVHQVAAKAWNQRPFSKATLREIWALRRELRAERYDVCVDLQGTLRSAVIGWMSGARRFVGSAAAREGAARVFYGERVRVVKRNVIGQACELVSAGVGRTVAAGGVEVPRDEDAEVWAAQFGVGFVLVNPSAGWGGKEWSGFRELVARFEDERRGRGGLAEGRRGVLVNGGSGGDSRAARVVQGTEALCVSCSLARFVALTRRAGVVVGGDTGPTHLGAALGRPTLALFGPTDPARNGPEFLGARVRVIRHAASATTYKRTAGPDPGLEQVSVDEVYAAVCELLGDETDG